jgi:hypothetical protein
MMTPIAFSSADKDAAWSMYVGRPDLPLRDVAAQLGVSLSTLRRSIRAWAWPPRAQVIAEKRREAARRLEGIDPALCGAVPLHLVPAAPGDPSDPIDLAEVARALGRTALRQLESLEAGVERGEAAPERAARILASLSRTLAAARALEQKAIEQKGGGSIDDDDDAAPRSLDSLREELARHLDRLVAEEGLERGFGLPDPTGPADPP